jgi:hypothetical protein
VVPAGFKGHHFLLQRDDVFLLFNQHGQQHHLERCLTREIGAGRRMVAGGGELHIERLLILTPQRTPVAAPQIDFLLDQLRERGKRAPHVTTGSRADAELSSVWAQALPLHGATVNPRPRTGRSPGAPAHGVSP